MSQPTTQDPPSSSTLPQKENETESPLVPVPTIPRRPKRHYPALDGLRGVAILGVMLFHGFLGLKWDLPLNAKLAALPQIGWLGVDIFFVLSGFLITGILLDTRDSPAHFRNFYARRSLRIIPVYYLLLVIVFLILPWFIPFDTPGLQTIQHRQAWFWTYLTNISFVFYRKLWVQSDWLDLNHLWSLAVEEQFYLFWPMVVYFLNRRWLKRACVACVVMSLALRIVLWKMGQGTGSMYFPTPCRLDGLAIGSLVAILIRDKGGFAAIFNPARIGTVIAAAMLVSLGFLRGGIVFTDKPTVVFGITIVNLLAACVVVMITAPWSSDPLRVLLNNRFLRMSGKYSYGLYLFHDVLRMPLGLLIPANRIVKAVGSELLGNLIFVGVFVALSYAVALLSWHAYEKQWLKLKTRFDIAPGSVSR
jgi:peptidoglycan/LPS O-acetylase OafA/YrhL